LHQHQFVSIGARQLQQSGSPAATHLLNIVTMMQGGLVAVGVTVKEDGSEEGENGFENLSTSFRLGAAELQQFT
jgi:hypothetical protein